MSIQPKYGILSPEQQAIADELLKNMPVYKPERPEMTMPQMTDHKQAYRADGGDIGTDRLREIADNPYGDEEKCWLAKRVLALLDELEAAESLAKQQGNIAVALFDEVTTLRRNADDKTPELRSQLEEAEKRIAELESDNAYIKNRHKELDLLIGKNILVMQAAIIEWQGTGDARKGLAWIYNTLFGPGELPDESEKDAQAYFDRKYAPLDEELMNLHRWFWEQNEADRAAAAGKGE